MPCTLSLLVPAPRHGGGHITTSTPSLPSRCFIPAAPAGQTPDADRPVEAVWLEFSSVAAVSAPPPVTAGGWSSRTRNPCSLQGSSLLHTEQICITAKPGTKPCFSCLCLNTTKGQVRKQGSENKKFLTCVFHQTALFHYRNTKVGDPAVIICCRDCYEQWRLG